jgi:predicted phosphodiesterase
MKELVWLTDPHLNFCSAEDVDRLLDAIAARSPDAILIGGDIGEANSVAGCLRRFQERLCRPCYFVLGNHDYYHGSIRGVREEISALCRDSQWLRWLPECGVVGLTSDVALVGHDGWGDGRVGSYLTSQVELNDFRLIDELRGLGRAERYRAISSLGDEAADYVRGILPDALARFRILVVLTHVPPWRETCWHRGRISDPDWLPYFTCSAVGAELRQAMESRPERQMLVLCGHSHSPGEARVLPNLRVLTGQADYGRPIIQRTLTLDENGVGS